MRPLNRRDLLSASLVSAAAALTGCAAIPTDGEVNHYADPRNTASPTEAIDTPAGPVPGATPTEIIDGFLHAGVGANDDYSVARLFLTESLAQSWRPDGQTLIYNSSVTTEETGQDTFTVTVPTSTLVDGRGLATSYTEATENELEFSLRQVEGEWRIATAPDGTVLSRTEFGEVFSPFTLYFYDPTFTQAVPDVRWFVERPTVATSLVRVLLEGPAPYLEGGVITAIPPNTSLTRNSVTVENGRADVQLSGGPSLQSASALDLERLRTQLTQTLSNLSSITSTQLSINNQVIDTQDLENYREPTINAEVPPFVLGVENNRLVMRDNLSASENQSFVFAQSGVAPAQPAMNYSRTSFSFTATDRSELWLATLSEAHVVHRGVGILQPSYDHQNWLWIAQEDGSVRALAAGQRGAEPGALETWLHGQTLLSLAVARDGARVALVTSTDGATSAWISAIRRAEDGAPLELLDPVQVGTGISPDGVEWVSDEDVILWNTTTAETEMVSLTGQSTRYDNLPDIEHIVTGSGVDQVVATSKTGTLFIVAGNGWTRIESSLSALNYSG